MYRRLSSLRGACVIKSAAEWRFDHIREQGWARRQRYANLGSLIWRFLRRTRLLPAVTALLPTRCCASPYLSIRRPAGSCHLPNLLIVPSKTIVCHKGSSLR